MAPTGETVSTQGVTTAYMYWKPELIFWRGKSFEAIQFCKSFEVRQVIVSFIANIQVFMSETTAHYLTI